MGKLLFINACFTDDSRTKVLADAVLKKWDGEIEEVKLNDGSIKALTKDQLVKRTQLQETDNFSDEMFKYSKQFASADAVVIAAPYWDLSFPASLKDYIEQVNVCGITFDMNSNGVVTPKCNADRMVYITTAGGTNVDFSYGVDYVKSLAREFFGIQKFNVFKADGLDIEGADVEGILAEPLKRIEKFSFVTKTIAPGEENYIVESKDLTKMYGSYAANNKVSLHLREGSIYGLIGRNGAGKSTFMRLLLGMTPINEGEISVFGKTGNEMAKVRNRIGFIIENPTFYNYMSAYQNLKYRAELIGLKNPDAAIKEALQKVGLLEKMKQKVKSFSMGQRQLLGIANAILGNPELLVLDEPTNGLDPIKIVEIRKMLLDMNANGTTILISSHILGEMGKLCSCYGFILDGKLIKEVTEEEIESEAIDVEEFFVEMAKGGQNG